MVVDLASGQTKVGRFGWKAQHATLVAFVADAFRNEMGIPSDMLPQDTRSASPTSRCGNAIRCAA